MAHAIYKELQNAIITGQLTPYYGWDDNAQFYLFECRHPLNTTYERRMSCCQARHLRLQMCNRIIAYLEKEMFGDVVSQTKYNNQLCLTVNKPWQETTRSCLCFEFDAPSVNMSEDLYNTPNFADCVKSDEKLANPTHIPQNLRCILLIYFFNVLIGLQCGSTLSYLLTTEQVTWWMIANTVYAIHGIVLTAIDISWMLRPRSWSRSMRNRCCGNVHAPSVTIGVAPGGAGGTLAPPPLKVGGPGPPTFGAGKKSIFYTP